MPRAGARRASVTLAHLHDHRLSDGSDAGKGKSFHVLALFCYPRGMQGNAKKTAVIGVPVTPRQRELFRKVARSQGHTLAAWFRHLALKAAGEAGR